jgi:hypothetical protein
MALDAGMTWYAASVATRSAYSTVRKHARLMGYEPTRRIDRRLMPEIPEVETGQG